MFTGMKTKNQQLRLDCAYPILGIPVLGWNGKIGISPTKFNRSVTQEISNTHIIYTCILTHIYACMRMYIHT